MSEPNGAPAMDIIQQAKDALPEIKVTDWDPTKPTSLRITERAEDQDDPRAGEATELIRQVEYYFSEENLPHDKHLLGMIKEGNGTVSLNELCGFKAMRGFKPKTWVREVLQRSTLVEVCGNGKRLRRRMPLQTSLSVVPEVRRDTPSRVVPEDKPWLTKGMLKPTGFEEGAETVTEKDAEQNDNDYDPEIEFTQRIVTAIGRFCARRKMHQKYHQVLNKFLIYCGFRGGQMQFIGGLGDKATEDFTKKELAEQIARYDISEIALKGLDEKKWYVAFELTAKGFLSSPFMVHWVWQNKDQSDLGTSTIRNFYDYLLVHNVCPEHEADVKAAIKVCDKAAEEFPKLAVLDKGLPGGFNTAASMLFGGYHSDKVAIGGWDGADNEGKVTLHEAWTVFKAHIIVHGTKEQIKAVMTLQQKGQDTFVLPEFCDIKVGLEIVGVEMPDEAAQTLYNRPELKKSDLVEPMGKLRCKEWRVPTAAPVDLPAGVTDPRHDPDPDKEYVFLLEASTLKYCLPGVTFEATLRKAHPDLLWIDYFQCIYPSFYASLPNDDYRDWKEPGPPTAWMMRMNAKKDEVVVKEEAVVDSGVGEDGEEGEEGEEGFLSDEEQYDDEEPD